MEKRKYKTNYQFWPVLGSLGCREKKLPTAINMQLFSADPTIVLKIFKMLFWPPKVEKTTLKIFAEFLRSTFFSSTALTAQMAQTEFKFQNVAYWPTVYRTGRSSNSFMSFNSNNRPITGGTKSWSFPVYCLFCLKRQNLICIFVQFLSLC